MKNTHPDPKLSNGATTALSIALFIHLFIVFVMLSANFSISALQNRLLTLLRPYTQALNLDLNFTPFHLTHGTASDVDHQIEYRLNGPQGPTDWERFGNSASPWSQSSRRFDRWARMTASYAEDEVEQIPAEISRAAAIALASREEHPPSRLRVRRHLLQTMAAAAGRDVNAQRNPYHESYFATVYEANVVIDRDGQVSIAKVAGRAESAQPAPASGDTP